MLIIRRSICCCILLGFLLAFCAPGSINKIDIERIEKISLAQLSEESISFEFGLIIRNPRSQDVTLKDLNFELELAGSHLGRGLLEDEVTIAKNSTARVDVPVDIRTSDFQESQFYALFDEHVDYRIAGTTTLLRPIKKTGMKVNARGMVPIPKPMRIELKDLSAASLVRIKGKQATLSDVLTKKGRTAVEVINPFSFPLSVSTLSFELTTGSTLMADGRMTQAFDLVPGSNFIEVPVKVYPFRTLVGALGTVLKGNSLSMEAQALLVLLHDEEELPMQFFYSPVE